MDLFDLFSSVTSIGPHQSTEHNRASPMLQTNTNTAPEKWPTQAQCDSFYGNPRLYGWKAANLVTIKPPYGMTYAGAPIAHITIHKRCADSLSRVLSHVWETINGDLAHANALGITRFSGSYNFRPIRGSRILSMHAYGAAIDFDAENNPLTYKREIGCLTGEHPLVKAFKLEGWIWGGDWKGRRDPMHFQAARVR